MVGSGLLETCGAAIVDAGLRGPRCVVVADEITARLFADVVLESLRKAGLLPSLIKIPSGESAKSLEGAGAVCEQMAAAGLDRSSFVVALGGGVVGDLAGFAAAIYHRGLPLVQIPTTLLAQVDSAIGGKSAVNLASGKNLLGAIHQPALVLADVETLNSLPAREFQQGYAEIIKYAVIADASLFDELSGVLQPALIARIIEIKAAIVARDERDMTGARALLNFGHTVGHAIEHAAGYGTYLHGEAVSLGMVAACAISVWKAGLSEAEREKVIASLESFSLPIRLPSDFPREKILAAVQSDKKIEDGQLRFVVTPRLGTAVLSREVTMDDVERAVREL